MKLVDRCPCCESSKLTPVKRYEFERPSVTLPEDFDALVRSIALERLFILFEYLAPGAPTVSLQVVRCRSCGFCFTNPRLTDDDIETKYEAIIEHGFTKERYKRRPARNLPTRAKRVRRLLESCQLPLKGDGSAILDVGGAWGYNLLPFRDRAKLFVVDFERWALDSSVRWLGETVEDIPREMKFEGILYLHTLEHETDPVAVLKALASRLTPDGRLYVEVPLGVFWEITHLREPVTHLNFFSERSLCRLFERCGLHVVHLSTRYQWITTGRQWCINIVAGRDAKGRTIVPKSDWLQRRHPWYFLVKVMDKLASRVTPTLGKVSRPEPTPVKNPAEVAHAGEP